MKGTLILTIFIIVLTAAPGFAQMGHGMMRDSQMMGQEGMHGQQGMGSGRMMGHQQMMGNIKGMTRDMSNIMGRVSETMGNLADTGVDASRENMSRMSDLMRDMAAEMNRMSWIMDKGISTEEEIRDIQNRMMKIDRRMNELSR